MNAGKRQSQTGFTLVEVMVALTILSLVMLVTTTGIRTLARTQVSIERLTDRVDEMRTVSAFMRGLLQSAVLGSGGESEGLTLGGGGSGSSYFDLGANGFSLRASLLMGEVSGGTRTVRIAKEDDALVLRWTEKRLPVADGRWNGESFKLLAEDIQDFNVAYRRDVKGPWLSRWERGAPPRQLRVSIKSNDKYWPELIMAVLQ